MTKKYKDEDEELGKTIRILIRILSVLLYGITLIFICFFVFSILYYILIPFESTPGGKDALEFCKTKGYNKVNNNPLGKITCIKLIDGNYHTKEYYIDLSKLSYTDNRYYEVILDE